MPSGYIWRYRFGNFISAIVNYKKFLSNLKFEIGDSWDRKKETTEIVSQIFGEERDRMLNAFEEWKNKYKTSMVIPANSTGFMSSLFQKLYEENGALRHTEKVADYSKGFKESLIIIENLLEVYDNKFSERNDWLDSAEQEMPWNKYSYKEIFKKCPFIQYLLDEDNYERIAPMVYKLFKQMINYEYYVFIEEEET